MPYSLFRSSRVDPVGWVLEASEDNATWRALDARDAVRQQVSASAKRCTKCEGVCVCVCVCVDLVRL